MPSRRDVLKAGGVVAAGLAAGGVARAGAWSPALYEPPVGTWLQPRYGFGNSLFVGADDGRVLELQ